MYSKIKTSKTSIKVNKSYEGETIEQKVRRVLDKKEPIKDGAPRIYTERKDGIQPQYNIRTDRFDLAIEAMDKVTKSHTAKREARLGQSAKENMEKEAKTEKQKPSGDPSQ